MWFKFNSIDDDNLDIRDIQHFHKISQGKKYRVQLYSPKETYTITYDSRILRDIDYLYLEKLIGAERCL